MTSTTDTEQGANVDDRLAASEPRRSGEGAPASRPSAANKPWTQALIDGLAGFATSGVGLVGGLAVGIELLTRAVAPCLRGLGIGLDSWINRAAFLQDTLSLTLMIAAFALGSLQVTAMASSRTPLFLRALAMLGAGVTMLVMLASPSADHPPLALLVTSAASGATLALLAGAVGFRDATLRWAAIAAFGVSIGTSARTMGVFFAARAATAPRSDGMDPARVMATVGFGADVLVLLAVTIWAATRSRRVALPLVALAIGLAAWGTRWTVVAPDETSALAMILRLGPRMMMSRPVPLVPYWMEIFGIVYAFLIAAVALAIPKQTRAVSGALALFALVRCTGEIPLHATLVAVGALGLLLTQFSPRSFWANVPDARAPTLR